MDYKQVYDELYMQGYHLSPSQNWAKTYLVPWIVENLEFDSVIDLGCSNGASLDALKPRKTKGIDCSSIAVERAKTFNRDVDLGLLTAIPVPDKSYDLVMSSDVMEHIEPQDLEKAITEQVRVAKKYIAHRIHTGPAKVARWNNIAKMNLHRSIMTLDEWELLFTVPHKLVTIHKDPKVGILAFLVAE